ncbi:MAG: translocation/assembly module TamB domain-containing protein [bacterium]|nr:translocation/assembly module TamB domain-containing protein [bacterium]
MAATAVILVRWHDSPVRRTLNARVADWIAAEFGDEARIGRFHLGGRSLMMQDVTIPLDHHGSNLRAESVTATLDWLQLAANPREPLRVLREVSLSHPVLTLAVSRDSSVNDSGSWIPPITIPAAAFHGMSQLDGLQSGDIDDGRIILQTIGKTPREVCHFNATLTPAETDGFQLAAYGCCLSDTSCRLTLTGALKPTAEHAEAQLLLDIPPGSVPGLGNPALFIATDGGRVALRAETADSLLIVRGSAVLTGIKISIGADTLRIPNARMILSSDSILFPTLPLEQKWFRGEARGVVVLRGRGFVDFTGEALTQRFKEFAESLIGQIDVEGDIAARFRVTGSWDDPRCEVGLSGRNLRIAGRPITDVRAGMTIGKQGVELTRATATVGICSAEFAGSMRYGELPTISGAGRIGFSSPPGIFGWESRLKGVRLKAHGTARDPQLLGQLFSVDDQAVGEVTIGRLDSGWYARAGVTAESSGYLYAIPEAGGITIRGEDMQQWIGMMLGGAESVRAIETFGFSFHGNERAGDLYAHIKVNPDSTEPWTHLARDFQFTGAYEQLGSERTSFSGQWSGIAGGGFPFEGSGCVTLDQRRLVVDRFAVDNVGDVHGWVDLETQELNLDAGISGLSLERILSGQAWFERMKLHGDISGYAQVQGSLRQPQWTANVAMTYGSLLGIGGYWINLEADGIGRRTNLRSFELGRDIRRITSATGHVDFDTDSLAIHAVIEDADANDLFLATTGKRNILTGNLNAWATLSGRISRPDIEAHLAVEHGELFGELYADECQATLHTTGMPDGRREYQIPECVFRKDGAYQFTAWGSVGAENGRLSAHVEGSGDFLDLIDQVDRTFQTLGSSGSFQTEIGGTLKHPELLNATLAIDDGRFSYVDACPSIVETEASLSVSGGGSISPGYLRFRVGDRTLEIALTPAAQSIRSGLESLVIPTPCLNLGVIEISTGTMGMPMRLPGLMKADWSGVLSFGSSDGIPVTISSAGEGCLAIEGQAAVQSARLTFPFVGGSGNPRPVAKWLMNRLKEAQWNMSVAVESGNHYSVEITGLKDSEMFAPLRTEPIFNTLAEYIDHLSIDAIMDPTDNPIRLSGRIDDETFRLSGRITSSRGTADYLDQTFRVDRVTADFDETDVMPILEGRGITQGTDSLGRLVEVYLTMYQLDRETNTRQPRGRLDQVTFVLESDVTETPEQALALLGYDQTDVGGKAEQVVTSAVTRVIGRRWLDPIERRLERWTLFDEIALTPVGGRATAPARQQREKAISDTLQQSTVVRFFRGSQVTVGKYVTPDLFLTYTGELAEGQVEVGTRIGFVHSWNAEYRMNPLSRDLVLDFAVEYDEIERRRDESISLKYSFVLEP